MLKDLTYFTVTIEGLGQRHSVNMVLPDRNALRVYDPEVVIYTTVDRIIQPLAEILRQKLSEAVYG